MKKILFIDRDGTIIKEPPDEQVDSLEKLEFYPKVIFNLNRIATELEYDLVMVTNQDGLGTSSFPEKKFWPAHQKMLNLLENEGVQFSEVLIDRSFPNENAPTRKPGTALLTHYIEGDHDLQNSYVIGDRATDVQLAQNLGAKAILIGDEPHPDAMLTTTDWDEITDYLRHPPRIAEISRETNETKINIRLNLDGSGKSDIQTGLGFFDHMLTQIAQHSGGDLTIRVDGDLEIDEHHTIEDTALALGDAFHQALGDKKGIDRYGFMLPMDDALARVALDFSGRSWLVWKVEFKREKIGDVPTEMFFHFFKSFCETAKCNLHVKAKGENEHHKIEAIFKALGRSIKQAIYRSPGNQQIPSSKGLL